MCFNPSKEKSKMIEWEVEMNWLQMSRSIMAFKPPRGYVVEEIVVTAINVLDI